MPRKIEELEGLGLIDFFKPIMKEYNNVSKSTLKEYGNLRIQSPLIVARTPFFTSMTKLIKKITLSNPIFFNFYT